MKRDYFYIIVIILLFLLVIDSNSNKKIEPIIKENDTNDTVVKEQFYDLKNREFSLQNLMLEAGKSKNIVEKTTTNNSISNVVNKTSVKHNFTPYVPTSTFKYYLLGSGNGKQFLIGVSNMTNKEQNLSFNFNRYYNYKIFDTNNNLLYTSNENIFEVYGSDIKNEILKVGTTKVFTIKLNDILQEGDNNYILRFDALAKELLSLDSFEIPIKGNLVVPERVVVIEKDKEDVEENTDDTTEENLENIDEVTKEDNTEKEIEEKVNTEHESVKIDDVEIKFIIKDDNLELLNDNEDLDKELYLLIRSKDEKEYKKISFKDGYFYFDITENIISINISLSEESEGVNLFVREAND